MGAVHLSALSISSSEKSQILQNTVPSIIQVSRDENPMYTPPMVVCREDSATASITKVTDTAIRLDLEWKKRSTNVNTTPRTKPKASESTTSSKGSSITCRSSTSPADPKDLEIEHYGSTWLITGTWLERLIMNINFDDYESRNYFDVQLHKCGLFKRLEEMGIQDGDTVDIYDFQFEYQR